LCSRGLNGGDVCGTYCENYCFARTVSGGSACAEDIGIQQCMDRCSYHPSTDTGNDLPGEMHATGGDSVQCRIYHAAAAFLLDDSVHCVHSSFEGGNVCGTYCDNYCNYQDTVCDGSAYFADETQCQRACAAMNDGLDGATDGASVNCRLYHISVAATLSDPVHCTHADFRSAEGACGSECDHLCEFSINFCSPLGGGDGDGGWGSGTQEHCVAICNSLPVGTVEDTAVNTLGCRNYHIDFAILDGNADALDHCQHSGNAGGAQCGDWCDSYCAQQLEVCPSAFETNDACLAACENFDGFDSDDYTLYSADSADNMQCRLYHVGASSFDPDNAAAHCDHSSTDGGGVCIVQPTIAGESSEPAPESSEANQPNDTEETGSVASLMFFLLALTFTLL